ncbi:TPA: VENN motif pre-toxin domain-containing protein, partial [Neisseria weaveri]
VTQQFGSNIGYVKSQVNRRIEGLKAAREAGRISQEEYDKKVQNLQYLNIGLSSASAALSAPTDSALGLAASAASPISSYAIGQYFKAFEDENNKLSSEKEAARVLAHSVLGASVAALGGNNEIAGAISSGGAEAVAPIVSNWLYGTDDPEQLTADQKSAVSAIAGLTGAVSGGTVSSSENLVLGYQLAQNAVDHNFHFRKGERAKYRQELQICSKQKGCDTALIVKKWEKKSIQNQKELYSACDKGITTLQCNNLRNLVDTTTYNGKKDYWYPTGVKLSASTEAALYVGFGGNIKVNFTIGNRGASAQLEGGAGTGIGVKVKAGKWEKENSDIGVSTDITIVEKTFGVRAKDHNSTLSTKASAEGYFGPLVVGSEIEGGREYESKNKSSIYKHITSKAEIKPQVGVGVVAKWDFLNYRTKKYEKKLR